jgi:hypothetical protein
MAVTRGRITAFFQQGTYGWSETIFNTAPDYGTLLAAGLTYATQRAGFLGDGAFLTEIRVSDDALYRDAFVRYFDPPLNGKTGPAGPNQALPPNVALLLRLTSTEIYRRPLYMRGIPANIVDLHGKYAPTPAWTAGLNAFSVFLTTGSWQVLATQRTGLPTDRHALFQVSAPNNFTLTPPAPALAIGTVVRILGSSRNHNPVGLRKVVSIAGLIYGLSGVDLPADYVYVPGSLSLEIVNRITTTITQVQPETITRRATGRPSGAPRGRRSAVRV